MNQKTLTALNKSIKHWERMATGTQKNGEDISDNSCALCKAFMFPKRFAVCEKCPVRLKTGNRLCDGSPYMAAADAFRLFGLGTPEFMAVAKKELKFLKSLLPNKDGGAK